MTPNDKAQRADDSGAQRRCWTLPSIAWLAAIFWLPGLFKPSMELVMHRSQIAPSFWVTRLFSSVGRLPQNKQNVC